MSIDKSTAQWVFLKHSGSELEFGALFFSEITGLQHLSDDWMLIMCWSKTSSLSNMFFYSGMGTQFIP